jgi:hypothetical protein
MSAAAGKPTGGNKEERAVGQKKRKLAQLDDNGDFLFFSFGWEKKVFLLV